MAFDLVALFHNPHNLNPVEWMSAGALGASRVVYHSSEVKTLNLGTGYNALLLFSTDSKVACVHAIDVDRLHCDREVQLNRC